MRLAKDGSRRHRWLVALPLALAMIGGVVAPASPLDPLGLLSPDPGQEGLDQPEPAGPDVPVVALAASVAELDSILAAPPSSADPTRVQRVRTAASNAQVALDLYLSGAPEVPGVIGRIGQAAGELEAASSRAGDELDLMIEPVAQRLASTARRLATDLIEVARAAEVDRTLMADADSTTATGDQLAAEGEYHAAIGHYNQGSIIATGSVTFDIDLFEQNFVNVVGPNVVGFAYAINQNGQLYNEDRGGLARTSADSPSVPQSPTKEQFLASVSKTITGVAMLRALQDANIPVHASIASYLPPYWSQGPNVDQITFGKLLTHRSGFDGVGSDYAGLKARIEQGGPSLPLLGPYNYSNANFGLMRILIPGVTGSMDGINSLIAQFPLMELTLASVLPVFFADQFIEYVRTTILNPIGIDGHCRSTDPVDTRYYNLPHGGNAGYQEPSRVLSCGGFGWFLSANELAVFMAHLRYTNTLLSASTRALMDMHFLGWLDPTQFSFSTGAFGVYHNHGGDWFHSPGEAHTCIMKFPIQVEVSLVINSERGFSNHQCRVLRNAFDAAWVAA